MVYQDLKIFKSANFRLFQDAIDSEMERLTRKGVGTTKKQAEPISQQQEEMGPFAASGHMVQNAPCWRASYELGHPQQRKCKFVLMKSLCSGCPSGQLALSAWRILYHVTASCKGSIMW